MVVVFLILSIDSIAAIAANAQHAAHCRLRGGGVERRGEQVAWACTAGGGRARTPGTKAPPACTHLGALVADVGHLAGSDPVNGGRGGQQQLACRRGGLGGGGPRVGGARAEQGAKLLPAQVGKLVHRGHPGAGGVRVGGDDGVQVGIPDRLGVSLGTRYGGGERVSARGGGAAEDGAAPVPGQRARRTSAASVGYALLKSRFQAVKRGARTLRGCARRVAGGRQLASG